MSDSTVVKIPELNSDDLLEDAFLYLTLNASFISDLGLFHGKMGCVLFFAQYARYTHDEYYEEFANELLDEICEDIIKDIPFGLEYGLCGIGWGIEYLVQNGFLEGDTDEILEDFDNRIMEYDVLRMSDLSFRQGLAGIAFYVIARLSALRDSERKPFDSDYLCNLGKALLAAKFLDTDECPPLLIETYLNVLNGIKPENIRLPGILECSVFDLTTGLSSLLLGLENGIAGALLFRINKKKVLYNSGNLFSRKKYNLVIFDEVCRAANYGIGTYMQTLIKALQNSKWKITIVHLRVYRGKTMFVETRDGMTHLFIADIKRGIEQLDWQKQYKRYYRSVLLLLNPYLIKSEKTLFHLNYMRMADLAIALKDKFPLAKIFVTVHYTEWSFILFGDKGKLQEILANPEKKENYPICKCVELEKQLLNVCDQVIAIAQHSYDDLIHIYGIPFAKIVCIPHGIEDVYQKITKKSALMLRQKYGYNNNEKILVFAGRLDVVKGEEILAKAFVRLVKDFPELRLIVAGDGNFNNILSKISDCWSKITFTGFVDKKILYQLFSIADIGVLPSLHEEFGYVAIEMMMMELPLIVGGTSGLLELVENTQTGLTIPWNGNDSKDENVSQLVNAISYLFNNPSLLTQYGVNGREKFLKRYTFDKFKTAYMNIFQ